MIGIVRPFWPFWKTISRHFARTRGTVVTRLVGFGLTANWAIFGTLSDRLPFAFNVRFVGIWLFLRASTDSTV